jgi:hypothetical protein
MSKPIFIAGCPRSGTSILAFLLGKHRNILAYLEPRGVYELFNELVLRHPMPSWVFRSLFALWVPQRLAYAISKQQAASQVPIENYITPRTVFAALKPLPPRADAEQNIAFFRQLVEHLFGDYAKACGRSRWCVKAPTYLYPNIDLVHRIHPDMKFVHIVRDGRDTVASIMNQPWARSGSAGFRQAVRLWLTLEAGDQKASHLSSDTFYRIRLEDLLGDEQHIGQLCAFLEEDYDAPMRDYFHSRLLRQEAGTGRWRRDLTIEQVKYIERKGASILERHGYS